MAPSQPVQPQIQQPQPSQPSQSQKLSDPGLEAPIALQRQFLLQELNDLRNSVGSNNVVLDPILNNVAQRHSQDMAANNFFSHTNLNGKNANQRLLDIGIRTANAENIALSFSLSSAHLNLRNSPGHYANSINPTYSKVGFGIALNNQGQLLLTVVFTENYVQGVPQVQHSQSLPPSQPSQPSEATLDRLQIDIATAIRNRNLGI